MENSIVKRGVMEEIFIKGNRYTFIQGFKDNESLRYSYNELTMKTFGFDFEDWYKAGYWGDNYIPYSILVGDRIVANVSISIMEFVQIGEKKKYVQIGTVMTDSEYRNRGLSKYLIEKVIEEWYDQCDNIYLYANNSVLDFYPKYNFKSIQEYEYSQNIISKNVVIKAEKLDISITENRELLISKAINSANISKLSMKNNIGLIMFYCTSYFLDKIYYIRDKNILVIAEFDEEKLYIHDVFANEDVDLDIVIDYLSNKRLKKVILGFTPNNIDGYSISIKDNDDCTLFVIKEDEEFFYNKLQFPILSHT